MKNISIEKHQKQFDRLKSSLDAPVNDLADVIDLVKEIQSLGVYKEKNWLANLPFSSLPQPKVKKGFARIPS